MFCFCLNLDKMHHISENEFRMITGYLSVNGAGSA